MSALRGDNITEPSPHTPWYHGPTLLGYLETVPVGQHAQDGPFRMPVQWVNRPGHDFRGFSGVIVGGRVRPGDRVRVVPSGRQSTVARIVTMDGDLDEAIAEQSVTLTLADEIDISRGDVLCAADAPAGSADQFEAHVVWMAEHEMLPGRPYLLKLGTQTVPASLSRPKYRVDVNTLEHAAATTLALNEIGVCNLNLDRPIAFDPYAENRDMGGFVLIDRLTNATVGAGMLHFALRRSQNIHWQALEVDKAAHAELKGHRPCVVWFTGLSGAGKSSIANLVEKRLHALGVHTTLLDGDNVRHGLNKDLGFTEADRVENIRRVAEVSRLMVDAGLVVLVSFISPFRAERRMARGHGRTRASSARCSSTRRSTWRSSGTSRASTERRAAGNSPTSPASTRPTSRRRTRRSASTRRPRAPRRRPSRWSAAAWHGRARLILSAVGRRRPPCCSHARAAS